MERSNLFNNVFVLHILMLECHCRQCIYACFGSFYCLNSLYHLHPLEIADILRLMLSISVYFFWDKRNLPKERSWERLSKTSLGSDLSKVSIQNGFYFSKKVSWVLLFKISVFFKWYYFFCMQVWLGWKNQRGQID